MSDPLAQVIALLQPGAFFAGLVTASGQWAIRPPGTGPFHGALRRGDCELSICGRPPVRPGSGDVMPMPAVEDLTVTSLAPPPDGCVTGPVEVRPGIVHLGGPGAPDMRMLIGHRALGSHDAAPLASLLPSARAKEGK